MRRRSNTIAASLIAVSLAALSGISCGGTDSGPASCPSITGYTASSTNLYSFATDIYPILSNTTVPAGTMPVGCSQALICHGDPPMYIDNAPLGQAGTKFLKFTDPPATVKAALLGMSQNAPTMARVVPGSVANSFMAYKLSGSAGLACALPKCVAGAGVSDTTACGDAMPSNGTLAETDRIKILDWIANGAGD